MQDLINNIKSNTKVAALKSCETIKIKQKQISSAWSIKIECNNNTESMNITGLSSKKQYRLIIQTCSIKAQLNFKIKF